jgi:mxaC protein
VIASLDFTHPWALLLAPLALLPLWRPRIGLLSFSYVAVLPPDRLGRLASALWRGLAVVAMLGIVLFLAGPGTPQTQVTRTGHGAEILVLIDRSRSMDLRMLPSNWRKIDPLIRTQQAWHNGPVKSKSARDLLAKFVAERPDDRFSLMFFSTGPLLVVPFTQHDEIVQAGITAGGVGRGLSDTDVGRALLASIREFEARSYSGSRIVLLVSDGGAQLDPPTRARIRTGLLRNRISLYWLYLRSVNSPNLETKEPDADAIPEIALHRFFQSLPTPYRAYQAEEKGDLERAVADVGKQQNFPLDFVEQVPRRDFGWACLLVGTLACALLLVHRAFQLRQWS